MVFGIRTDVTNIEKKNVLSDDGAKNKEDKAYAELYKKQQKIIRAAQGMLYNGGALSFAKYFTKFRPKHI